MACSVKPEMRVSVFCSLCWGCNWQGFGSVGGCGAKNRAAACQNLSWSWELGAPLRRQVWDRAGDLQGDAGAEKEAAKVEIPEWSTQGKVWGRM